jgi:hypothetical protein
VTPRRNANDCERGDGDEAQQRCARLGRSEYLERHVREDRSAILERLQRELADLEGDAIDRPALHVHALVAFVVGEEETAVVGSEANAAARGTGQLDHELVGQAVREQGRDCRELRVVRGSRLEQHGLLRGTERGRIEESRLAVTQHQIDITEVEERVAGVGPLHGVRERRKQLGRRARSESKRAEQQER